MEIVNTRIMKNPLNWATLWAMALILFYVGHLLLCYFSGVHPGQVGQSSTEGIAGPGTDVPQAQ